MNWKRSLIGVAIALPIVALLAFGMTKDPSAIPSPLPGKPAPDFALAVIPGVGGVPAGEMRDSVHLRDHLGHVVVVNFYASWCLSCRAEHPVLAETAREYKGKDVQFYSILYNDTPDNGRAWIKRMGGQPYPSLYDPDSRTAINFGLYGVPETFFIARDGKVAYKQVGPATPAVLHEKIDMLLAQPAPAASAGGSPTSGTGGAS
jgi:cytochrome c biogenesis protein CcmG/thiol:disulfide interchange protein DsbE